MSWKRCIGLALVLAVALGGCKKKEESQEQAPQQQAQEPGGDEEPGESGEQAEGEPGESGGRAERASAEQPSPATPVAAASEADSEEVLKALDDSVDSLAGGLGGAFGGLAMARKASASGALDEESAADEDDEPPPIQRVQMHMDLDAFRASPFGGLAQGLLGALRESGEIEENEVCLLDLLDKVHSAFFDVQLGPDGEPTGIVVSVKSSATKEEVLSCMEGSLDEGQEIKEIEIAGGTGYTVEPSDDPVPAALFEKAPGHWLFGMRPTIEEIAGGDDPEADETFQALAAPLGDGVIRIAMVPTAEFAELAAKVEGDAPPPVQCLQGVITHFKGGSAGVRLSPDFSVSLALQNGSATEAAETQACLNGVWQILKPVILSEAGDAEAAQMQAMFGMSLAQLLDAVKIEAAGDFAKISVSLPGDVLGKIVQLVAAMAM